MGHKVHPYGFRLGVSRTWTAKWYADNKEYTASLQEDIKIRQLIDKRLANASVSGVEIERGINHVTVTIHTAKPGIVIGKGGANVEVLRQQIGALTTRKVKLEIKEIRQPELDAYLVAMNIAGQLTRRIAFKKAMKQAIQRSMKAGAKGVKIGSRAASVARRWVVASGTGGPHPARDAPRGHQLRPGPRPHDVRSDRRQGLDLPGRHQPGARRARCRHPGPGRDGGLIPC
jgi:small subunit ribosomal protein S3